MTSPFREAVADPAAGAVGEHDARTKPAAAVAATTADRDLRRLHHATRIPTRFLSPATNVTPRSGPRHHQAQARYRQETCPSSHGRLFAHTPRRPIRPAYLLDQYAIAIRCTPGNTTGTSSNNLRSARRCDRCWKAVNPSSPFGSPGIGRQPITGAAATTAARIAVALDGDPGGVPADETVRSVIGDTGYEIDLGGRGRISASIVQQDQAATGGR